MEWEKAHAMAESKAVLSERRKERKLLQVMAAIIKSLVCSPTSQATFLFVLVALVVQPQMVQPQPQTCSAQLGSLNMCAPFMVPGAGNPSTDCCNALQAVEHDCLCGTLRIAARLPSQCNVPSISCSDN